MAVEPPQQSTRTYTVAALIEAVARASDGALSAKLIGPDQTQIVSVAPLDQARADQLSFLANPRYRNIAAASGAGALVLTEQDQSAVFSADHSKSLIVCAQPYAWFAYAAQQLAPEPECVPGIASNAQVHPSAYVAHSACVASFAVIEAHATIGEGAWVGAGAYIGQGATVGAHARVHPGAKLLHACVLGDYSVIHGGAVIGADGFGFAPLAGRYIKIPQTGRVLIGAHADIGANTTIDRGTMGDTVIEDGVKIDNQVQVGHNCRIGAHTVIAGCVGIAGSATIGKGCQLGGAAMILGHLTIADGSVISSGTLVSRSIAEQGFYTGFFPLMSNRDWERNAAVVRQLSGLRDRVRALEQQLKDAEPQNDGHT